MKYFSRNIRTFIYYAIFFFFGSILTLSVMQIENTECIDNMIKEENYKYYKVSKLDNPELIILIISSPSNFDRRHLIRKTWLQLYIKTNNINVKHYFVVGSIGLSADTMLHLSTEQSKYNDLLILHLQDKYSNLTYKVLQSFVWLNEQISYGLNFGFVLKCDDDTFVRLDILTKDVKKLLPKYITNLKKVTEAEEFHFDSSVFSVNPANVSDKKRHLYWGYFNGNAKIKSKGKWREKDWILCDNYLPYALGGGYILSQGLISYIARNSDDLKLYNAEDVSVGTWLAPVANVQRLHDIRFDTEWTSKGCQNIYIVVHKLTMEDMATMFNNIQKTDVPCYQETLKRPHYLYNWNTSPSKCCTKI